MGEITTIRETRPLTVPELGEPSEDETHVTVRTDRAKKVQFTKNLRDLCDVLFCWECGELVNDSWLGFHLAWDHSPRIKMDDYLEKHGKVVVSK